MKLIIGLGNPGEEYKNSRHNLGHQFIDQLAKSNKQKAISSNQVKLHKTNIFMNESGKEVKELATRYFRAKARKEGSRAEREALTNLLIVHDDLDLPPGVWKLQVDRSSAGHKGVQSIIDELGTQEFWRLRIGIGKPPAGVETNDFVIEEPKDNELKNINKAIAEALPKVKEWSIKKEESR